MLSVRYHPYRNQKKTLALFNTGEVFICVVTNRLLPYFALLYKSTSLFNLNNFYNIVIKPDGNDARPPSNGCFI
jgi:hypothetical protein